MGSTPTNNNEDGLKFGQKIYFEDHGTVPPMLGYGGKTFRNDYISSSSSGSNSNGNNKKSGSYNNGQAPRCQVEGCKIDLSEAKTYYSRHKVCTFHSKSPMVILSGIQQRFCQQCSRFHQLSEFDQGKRSCRRRLAGHNERRRKPPPGSLLSSRLGRLSSSLFDCNTTGNGGFMLDFSSYSRHSEKDPWPDIKPHERVTGSHSTSSGKYLHNMWTGNSEDPSEMFLQGSVSVSNYPITPGECNTVTGGVSTDSSCALSLLSNQTWGSKNRSSSGMELNNLMNLDGAPCTEAHTVTATHIPSSTNSSSWGYKTHESNAGLQMMLPNHLGLSQISGSQTQTGLVPGDLLIDQVHDGHVHWSLS